MLVHEGRLVLIDLPQIVDVIANPQGADFIARDVRNVAAWFTSRGLQIDADELIAFARERLARFKVPKRIVVLEELPKTGTGKIQKFELRGKVSAAQP